jgi:glutaredoxin-like protein NrdH
MNPVPTTTVYTLPACPQCTATKRKLTELGVPYVVVDLSEPEQADTLVEFKAMGLLSAPIVEAAPAGGTPQVWSGYRPDLLAALA